MSQLRVLVFTNVWYIFPLSLVWTANIFRCCQSWCHLVWTKYCDIFSSFETASFWNRSSADTKQADGIDVGSTVRHPPHPGPTVRRLNKALCVVNLRRSSVCSRRSREHAATLQLVPEYSVAYRRPCTFQCLMSLAEWRWSYSSVISTGTSVYLYSSSRLQGVNFALVGGKGQHAVYVSKTAMVVMFQHSIRCVSLRTLLVGDFVGIRMPTTGFSFRWLRLE